VHLLFNNAGVSAGSTVWESTLNDWKWTLGVNLWGIINGVHFFTPIMIKQDAECHIVNTASAAGLLTGPGNCPYTVSKHGVVALSETLYREMEQRGNKIGVSVLCPGFIRTNILKSERNRPAELRNKPGEGVDLNDPRVKEMLQMATKLIENGMPPEQLADIVFSAIREKKFYILPNAEPFIPMMQSRLEDIVQQRNPTTVPMPF
jgi:NAD(P)-dependent dehydrogenase (short-subunit alcohol dehydrogenase family)